MKLFKSAPFCRRLASAEAPRLRLPACWLGDFNLGTQRLRPNHAMETEPSGTQERQIDPENMKRISVIVTIRLTSGLFEGEDRLKTICSGIPLDLYDITIVDYGTPAEHVAKLDALQQEGIQVVRHPSPKQIFSIGAARDFGVQMAKNPVVLFLDIDFHAPSRIFRDIHQLVTRKQMFDLTPEFFCVPVLFLTEKGTVTYSRCMDAGTHFPIEPRPQIIESATGDIHFPSYGSSAMVVNRRHYMAMGGHHQSFTGHGAEDFELLHRLASLAPLGERPADYYRDTRVKTLEPLSGFRPYFARHAIEALNEGIFLVHRYHPRRAEPGYLRRRQNFANLTRLMKRYDRKAEQPLPLTDPEAEDRVLVLATGQDADFDAMRPLISTFNACHFLAERSVAGPGKLESAIAKAGVNAVMLRNPYGSASRTALYRRLQQMGVKAILHGVSGHGAS